MSHRYRIRLWSIELPMELSVEIHGKPVSASSKYTPLSYKSNEYQAPRQIDSSREKSGTTCKEWLMGTLGPRLALTIKSILSICLNLQVGGLEWLSETSLTALCQFYWYPKHQYEGLIRVTSSHRFVSVRVRVPVLVTVLILKGNYNGCQRNVTSPMTADTQCRVRWYRLLVTSMDYTTPRLRLA